MIMFRDRFWYTLVAIGVITMVSGIVQCLAPDLLLRVLSPDVSRASRYFLTITGVMTASFGALLIHALRASDPQHVAILWVGVQKILTAAAVGLAIQQQLFSPLALIAAGFDLVSGVMIASFWFWIRQRGRESSTIQP
jgi:hypothetical protein